jgi:DNA polymerase III delta prime subunit
MQRVLALSMRPRNFEDLVGQDTQVNALKNQLRSGRVPHFYILSGPVGAGKTTLARIIAMHMQHPGRADRPFTADEWKRYKHLEIQEINAANQTGIEDVRKLVQGMRFKPLPPSTARVAILDEAHQLSVPAQNALNTETEDVADHVYIVFCTSQPLKIIESLRRRAYFVTPEPLREAAVRQLLGTAAEKTGYDGDTSELARLLMADRVTSPGLVLQSAERLVTGLTPDLCMPSGSAATSQAIVNMCRAISQGDWPMCVTHLRHLDKASAATQRLAILNYFQSVLLRSKRGTKAAAACKIIELFGALGTEDGPTLVSRFSAVAYRACEACLQVRAENPKANTVQKDHGDCI